ncbi:MAG: hypothetical protein L0G94_14600 [Brachybacterium sp.]|uniref:hypothetical protein n=1 Tax=Brachybacterium sp. TaxID=1891286 RepID=UPI0026477E25|nr:hypothetical protein [Brachybacterium sp.]MDN5687884.1 hypothetical protein [Brachybacterium sp.]
MQDRSDPRTSSAAWPALRDDIVGPPRPSWRARYSLALFGLLLVASLAIPVFTETPAMPGISLVMLGMLLLLGVAELLDPGPRRFVIAVRGGGTAIALLGFVIQMITR